MSIINPTYLPANVYLSSDVNALQLTKTNNSVVNIISDCLVKSGWTMIYDSTSSKILKCNTTDNVFVKMYNDNGNAMNIALVKDVQLDGTSTLLVECDTRFIYLNFVQTGEWAVIATSKGFWFHSQVMANGATEKNCGTFLYAGITPGTLTDAFIIKHTGGTWGESDDDRYSITSPISANISHGGVTPAAVYKMFSGNTTSISELSHSYTGNNILTDITVSVPLYLNNFNDVYTLPILTPTRNDLLNYTKIDMGDRQCMNFGTATYYNNMVNNTYVFTDKWMY